MTDARARLTEEQIEDVRRRHSLVTLVARRVKLKRSGRGFAGLCPFHDEKTPSFNVSDERGYFHCFGCGAHGDLFKWVELVEGLSFREAVLSLAGGVLPDARHAVPEASRRAAPERPSADTEFVSSATAGRWIWRSSDPARGEIVEAWLESRGLNPHAIFDGAGFALAQLRFHPRCPVSVWPAWEHPEDRRRTEPAMVAPIRDADGLVRGVHVTYLRHDGRAKADLGRDGRGQPKPARKMFGKVGGNAVWLTGNDDPALPLVVGEGLESTWAFAERFGRPCRVAATLSLENLQGGIERLKGGAIPLWNIRANPERPPFVVEGAGDVTIAVDSDMKPLRGQKVQMARGAKPVTADISGLQRAEICASLAVQHWRRAGATTVTAVRPPMGRDFNDQMRAA
jgi:hypothetical protein